MIFFFPMFKEKIRFAVFLLLSWTLLLSMLNWKREDKDFIHFHDFNLRTKMEKTLESRVRQAIGPKPQAEEVRRAVAFDEFSAAFWRPLKDSEAALASTKEQSVQEYVNVIAQSNLSWQKVVHVVAIGVSMQDAMQEKLCSFLGSMLHPLRVETASRPPFNDPMRMRMCTSANQALEMMGRAHLSEWALGLFPSSEEGVLRSNDSKRRHLVLQVQVDTISRSALVAAARIILFHCFSIQPCGLLECAMNSKPSTPFVLCPICLRKLSLVPPKFEVASSYKSYMKFCRSHADFHMEEVWLTDRLRFLGHPIAEVDFSVGEMKKQLQTLKKHMVKGPVFG